MNATILRLFRSSRRVLASSVHITIYVMACARACDLDICSSWPSDTGAPLIRCYCMSVTNVSVLSGDHQTIPTSFSCITCRRSWFNTHDARAAASFHSIKQARSSDDKPLALRLACALVYLMALVQPFKPKRKIDSCRAHRKYSKFTIKSRHRNHVLPPTYHNGKA